MRQIKKYIFRLYAAWYLLQVRWMYQFFGIEYVADQLAICSRHLVELLLRRYGATIGEQVNFKNNIQIDNAAGDRDNTRDFSNIHIGNRCYIGKGVFFDLPDKVIIEDECVISAGVKFITHADCGNRVMAQWYPRERGPIVIGYGSWIGANAIILNSVKLGKCCVVGAGSVVTQSFPDYSVVVGSPAKVVKRLEG